MQTITNRVLAPPIVKHFNTANQPQEEKKEGVPDHRPYLFVDYLSNVDDQGAVKQFDRLLRNLIQDSDGLLTSTLAEELADCLEKRFLQGVIGAETDQNNLRSFFSAQSEGRDVSVIEMVHGFIERTREQAAVLDDRNVQSKGNPRKGGDGKR